MDELKEGLRQRDELIEKHGLVIIPDGTPNGDVSHEPVVGAITVVSQEAAQVLESAGEGPLDVRLRKLAGEKEELLSQIRRLKLQLEEERQKCSRSEGSAADMAGLHNGSDLQFIEMQRDANRQISEYKFKLSKAEQDIATLEQNVSTSVRYQVICTPLETSCTRVANSRSTWVSLGCLCSGVSIKALYQSRKASRENLAGHLSLLLAVKMQKTVAIIHFFPDYFKRLQEDYNLKIPYCTFKKV